MTRLNGCEIKSEFRESLSAHVESLMSYAETGDKQWTIKGFIDVYRNIYTISADTKIISKILEIHLFPKLLQFADRNGYYVVLADHQNYYPDLSLISKANERLKLALDIKTTYRLEDYPGFCNGFTLGSHGKYFINRNSAKNVQFPYSEYAGHFCLGIIYSRTGKGSCDETRVFRIEEMTSIASVIRDFQVFVCEKWEIASDRSGSGNTANIGSIDYIEDLVKRRGVFLNLGEEVFDDYWMNYNRMRIKDGRGGTKKLTNLREFLQVKGIDLSLINPRKKRTKRTSDDS